MDSLRAAGLEGPAHDAADSGRPFLGICVGMQMLFTKSEENEGAAGLDLIPGTVTWIPAGPKIPQMQWNRLDIVDLTERIAARYGAPDVVITLSPRARREVSIDKVRYERILGNLIGNAGHHGGGAVEIQIEPVRGKRIRIAVIDDGPGVAVAERANIFKPYVTMRPKGVGLGLAIVHQIASAHHWEVTCDANVPHGALFRFSRLILTGPAA